MKNKKNMDETSSLRERTHDSVDNIMDKAESINESGKKTIAHLEDKAVKIRGNFDGYIQENPEKSVLIAAGVGIVVGGLIVALMKKRSN